MFLCLEIFYLAWRQNIKLEAENEFLSIVFLSLLWNGIYGKM